MPALINIIGPGRVGRTLGALLERAQLCEVQDVLSTRHDTAVAAVSFIGGGHAAASMQSMRAADLWLLTPPDAAMESVAKELAATGIVRSGDVVFHCSGALPSSVLAPLKVAGASIASVHPLKTFADPDAAVQTFAGTWCTVEGDDAALAALQPLFERLGAHIARIDAAGKTLYHAAAVLMCNDFVALMEAGLRAGEGAGLDRATVQAMMEPLVRETLDNVFRLGPADALTGPVARGDAAVVARQAAALHAVDPRVSGAYRTLGRLALELAQQRGDASDDALKAVLQALEKPQ